MKKKINISRLHAISLLSQHLLRPNTTVNLFSNTEMENYLKFIGNYKIRSKFYFKVKQILATIKEIHKEENDPVIILEYINKKLNK